MILLPPLLSFVFLTRSYISFSIKYIGDFEKVRIGDPLFITLNNTVIYYDGSFGDEVYLIFINEGGYYYASSGTGIGVAVPAEYHLLDGTFV
jgi:hypothetical protein